MTAICDYCANVAYDMGIETYDAQTLTMLQIGSDCEDHLCDETDTDGEVRCDCPCHSHKVRDPIGSRGYP